MNATSPVFARVKKEIAALAMAEVCYEGLNQPQTRNGTVEPLPYKKRNYRRRREVSFRTGGKRTVVYRKVRSGALHTKTVLQDLNVYRIK